MSFSWAPVVIILDWDSPLYINHPFLRAQNDWRETTWIRYHRPKNLRPAPFRWANPQTSVLESNDWQVWMWESKNAMNLLFGDDLYHSFMVILGMVHSPIALLTMIMVPCKIICKWSISMEQIMGNEAMSMDVNGCKWSVLSIGVSGSQEAWVILKKWCVPKSTIGFQYVSILSHGHRDDCMMQGVPPWLATPLPVVRSAPDLPTSPPRIPKDSGWWTPVSCVTVPPLGLEAGASFWCHMGWSDNGVSPIDLWIRK